MYTAMLEGGLIGLVGKQIGCPNFILVRSSEARFISERKFSFKIGEPCFAQLTLDILGADLDCEEWKNWKLKVEFLDYNNLQSDFSLINQINLFEK